MMLDIVGIVIAILTGTIAACLVELLIHVHGQKSEQESTDDNRSTNQGDK